MATSRGGRHQVRSQRRRTSWELGPGGGGEVAITAVGSQFIDQVISPTIDGLTLARLRGRMSCFLTAATAAGDGFTGAWGIGVATAAAVAAGIGSVPTPFTEQAWDGWIYWSPIQVYVGDRTAGDSMYDVASQVEVVDTKAMRKLNIEDAIYAAVEIEVEEGTAVAELRFDSRTLMFLP